MEPLPVDTTAIELKESLIQRATSVFMRLGVRAVNMADLSSELGISKKTLYKYVSDKRDLICSAWLGIVPRWSTSLMRPSPPAKIPLRQN